jgi:hypothetical protein
LENKEDLGQHLKQMAGKDLNSAVFAAVGPCTAASSAPGALPFGFGNQFEHQMLLSDLERKVGQIVFVID